MINRKGFSILEVMLALSILAAVLIPVVTYMPNVFRNMRDSTIKRNLVGMADSVDQYYDFIAYRTESPLITASPENLEVVSILPYYSYLDNASDYRINIKRFIDLGKKQGLNIILYYDQDANNTFTSVDKHYIEFYKVYVRPYDSFSPDAKADM